MLRGSTGIHRDGRGQYTFRLGYASREVIIIVIIIIYLLMMMTSRLIKQLTFITKNEQHCCSMA